MSGKQSLPYKKRWWQAPVTLVTRDSLRAATMQKERKVQLIAIEEHLPSDTRANTDGIPGLNITDRFVRFAFIFMWIFANMRRRQVWKTAVLPLATWGWFEKRVTDSHPQVKMSNFTAEIKIFTAWFKKRSCSLLLPGLTGGCNLTPRCRCDNQSVRLV